MTRNCQQQERLPEHASLDENAQTRIENVEIASESSPRSEETKSHEDPESEPESVEADLEDEKLQRSVRNLMRQIPSSVAILTVASVDPYTNKNVPMGVAISSMTTVSLNPPTISFNIKEPSKTLDAIRAAGGLFRVHIPEANQGGATAVDVFCKGNHALAYEQRRKALKLFVPSESRDKFSASSAPQIWSESVQTAMECTVTHELNVADHVILVAKIDSVEHKAMKDSVVMYHDGRYKRPDGGVITVRTRAPMPTNKGNINAVWSYPLFPGEKERRDYVSRIKTVVKGDKTYLAQDRANYKRLERNLPYSPAAFGIRLDALIAECRVEMGHKDERGDFEEHMPVLFEFYGRLTPGARAKIVDRMKNLVKGDVKFLSMNYRLLLETLGVSPWSYDFIPSDLLNPLRESGLVGATGSIAISGTYQDIYTMERIEKRLIEHLSTMGLDKIPETRLEDVMKILGENSRAAVFFNKSRARLLVLAHPTVFSDDRIDITGEISEEEVRVVLRRIIRYYYITQRFQVRSALGQHPTTILRSIRVDPTITGYDIDYLFTRISHEYHSTPMFQNFAPNIRKIIEPWLASHVDLASLEERVKHFVHKMPLRAISWNDRDKLAAIGLHWEGLVSIPGQGNEQRVDHGGIVESLVVKELKRFYGKGSEEENSAIAKYLKATHEFDVHKPDPFAKSLLPRPVSDKAQEAKRLFRNIGVRSRSRSTGPRDRIAIKRRSKAAGNPDSSVSSPNSESVDGPHVRFLRGEISMPSPRAKLRRILFPQRGGKRRF